MSERLYLSILKDEPEVLTVIEVAKILRIGKNKKDGRKGKKTTTRRVVPSTEMSIEDFDVWKTRLAEEAHSKKGNFKSKKTRRSPHNA